MANDNEPEVKIVERVEVAPTTDDELVESPDSSQDDKTDEDKPEKETESESEETEEKAEVPEKETEAETAESETEDSKATGTETEPESDEGKTYEELKRNSGETPREWALRLENARLRDQMRGNQAKEIFVPPPAQAKKELSPERKKILEKYKPQDIETLKEVFDVMAEDMGFVRAEQLNQTTYQQQASEVLEDFLEKHPEYQSKNDTGGALWGRFKEEFQIYKPTQNPRDLKKILEKVHKEVFGIKPVAALTKNEAAKEKVKVASHSGSSRPVPSKEGVRGRVTYSAQGLRTDMLKGFSDEEIAELTGSE